MASEYRLTGKLEEGELAELYRATREGSSTVVVKLFHERTSVKGYAQEIAETSNKLSQVRHPGVSQVIDIGLVKRRLAIVREDSGRYTLGQVLQRLNTKEVVITSAMALAIVVDLLEAVHEAHLAGVVHGAMTPGNVLVSAEGRPSICDFGALAALSSVAALKKNFAARGRSAYRAPELTKGDAPSIPSDLYSLGAMTYELLTLREAASEAMQVSTRREALPPPSRLDRRLNSRIDPVVMRALDPQPGRRYKTSAEFASALREFLTASGGMPAREEIKRFVEQLFPKELQLEPSTHVAFTESFSLSSVDGAELDDVEDRSMVVAPRGSYSPSVENMPAIEAQLPPELGDGDRERSTDWHAPVGAMPQTARSGAKESLNADVARRVKRIEDFGAPKSAEDTLPTGKPLSAEDTLPQPFPGRREPGPPVAQKTTVDPSPADSQPISGEHLINIDGKLRRMITEERNLASAEAARKRWLPLVAGSAIAALAFLALGLWNWSSGSEVSPYVPPPDRARPIPRPRPAQTSPPSAGTRPEPRRDNCYDPPKKGPTGTLSISTTRDVVVKIDGEPVCGSYSRIVVAEGPRKVVVIDTRTKETYDAPLRIEAGKAMRLLPIFKGKQ